MPRPFIPQLSSQCTAALQPSNATEHRRRLFRGTPGQANEGSRAEGNTTQTKRRKTNAHRGHRACDRRKKTETGRGQRRNTASRAESKATQRLNRRGPRTADRLTGYRKRRCQAHQQGHGASKGKKSSAEKKVVRIHLSALQGIRN